MKEDILDDEDRDPFADDDDDDIIWGVKKAIEELNKKEAPYISHLVKQLNLPNETASTIVSNASKIAYTADEFVEVVKYFSNEFEGVDNLSKFLDKTHLMELENGDIEIRKETIFSTKPYIKFGERIRFIEKLFNITRSECIVMITNNPSWIYHKQEHFTTHLNAIKEFFHIDWDKAVSLVKNDPFILGKRINVLSNNVHKIAEYYNILEYKVKELLLDYPLMMNQTLSYYTYYNIGKEIFDKHWLLEFILPQQGVYGFGGYRTFNNLVAVLDKIEQEFGDIIDFYKRTYTGMELFAVLVKNDSNYFIITVGSDRVSDKQRSTITKNTPEEKLIHAIFGVKSYDIPKEDEYINHHEYVCKLNSNENANVEDVLYIMAIISANEFMPCNKLKIKKEALEKSIKNSIVSFEIPPMTELYEDSLSVNFYKIMPIDNDERSLNIVSISQSKEKSNDAIDDILDDLDTFDFD